MGKAVKNAERALPLSLWKRTTVIKKLAMNSGISLESPLAKTKKITTNINDYVIEIVKNFYTRDDILQQASGKWDIIVVRKNSERKTFQKCHLSMTIMKAYQIFKKKHIFLLQSPNLLNLDQNMCFMLLIYHKMYVPVYTMRMLC